MSIHNSKIKKHFQYEFQPPYNNMQATYLLQLSNSPQYQLSTIKYRNLQEFNNKLLTMLKLAHASTKEI